MRNPPAHTRCTVSVTESEQPEGRRAAPDPGSEPDPFDRGDLSKLGMLVAGIAHNMNGPLTGILGNIDLLKMLHPELNDTLDKVGKIGLRLREDIRVITSKAVAEARRETGTVDLGRIVRDELAFYTADPRLKHRTELTVHIPDDLPAFRAVPGDFWQAFSDLLTNAVEAMADVEEKKLTISLRHEHDRILLSIADSGCGMDEETQRRALEPFFTTKRRSRDTKEPPTLATGIGLTHVKNLMDPLGVAIELDSREGEGTTVTLRIPYRKIEAIYPEPAN